MQVYCRYCHKSVARSATRCPHCTSWITPPRNDGELLGAVTLAAMIFTVWVLWTPLVWLWTHGWFWWMVGALLFVISAITSKSS